jgi:secondary thiamine-phosphate synthase enzyme
MREFTVQTGRRTQMVDITERVQRVVEAAEVRDGLAVVHVPHTTAGVTVNEGADPDVQRDILETLARLVPHRAGYAHAEGNADAHVKSSLVGCAQTLIVTGGRLLLGTWQRVFFVEADGPRTRKVYVEVIGKE